MQELNSIEDVENCLASSEERAVFIFKHSTTCPISNEARKHVEQYEQSGEPKKPGIYLIKVIESRPLSNKVAEDLGVQHQSPQLLLISNRKCVWSGSHYGIHGDKIRDVVANSV